MALLNDGKAMFFAQLLGEVGFSRNALKLRLKRLTAQNLVVKEKTLSNGRGRPKYAYLISPRVLQQVSAALSDPSITIVALQFSRQDNSAGSRRANTANKSETSATQEAALKSRKTNDKNHFRPI